MITRITHQPFNQQTGWDGEQQCEEGSAEREWPAEKTDLEGDHRQFNGVGGEYDRNYCPARAMLAHGHEQRKDDVGRADQ